MWLVGRGRAERRGWFGGGVGVGSERRTEGEEGERSNSPRLMSTAFELRRVTTSAPRQVRPEEKEEN